MPIQQPKKIDARVVVETPEGADFQFLLAGPGVRATAWLLDTILKWAIVAVTAILFSVIAQTSMMSEGAGAGLTLAFMFAVDWFYGTLFESLWNGQTPGKRSANLRVVRSNGTPIDLTCAAGRNFLRTADMLPVFYLTGIISMLMTRRLQRLGDLVFDTMVIDERREWIGRAKGITDSVEPLLRSECRGRFSVPDRTLAVIERLFENDRIVSDARREEIAKPLSDALQRRLGYEEPQPDPRNPHQFFALRGNLHTRFLLRVLKTFADDPSRVGATAPRTRTDPVPDPRLTRLAGIARTKVSAERFDSGGRPA